MKLALEFFKAVVEVLNWLDILSNAVSFSFTLAFKFEMGIQFPPYCFPLPTVLFIYIFWSYIGKKHHLTLNLNQWNSWDLVVRNLFMTEIVIELDYRHVVMHLADFQWRS